jgi:diaminopimelate epimerase
MVSDRHRGIGSDGLILVEALGPDDEAEIRMRMFNADGSEAEMCGNGIRCVAKFALDRGLAPGPTLRVATGAGVLSLETHHEDGVVVAATVDMGHADTTSASVDARIPGFEPSASTIGIDLDLDRFLPKHADRLRELGVDTVCSLVSMGNPHIVLWCDHPEAIDLSLVGPDIEHHHWFPQRINVHFVHVEGPHRVTMHTWERGSGVTLACGTGASAVCAAGALERRTAEAITARLPGGELELRHDRERGHVLMRGPAVEVFRGELDLAQLEESS